jgi:hypothetical protein
MAERGAGAVRDPNDHVNQNHPSSIPPGLESQVHATGEQLGLALATRDRVWLTRLLAPNVRLSLAAGTVATSGTTEGADAVVDQLFALVPALWRRTELRTQVDVTAHGALLTLRRANRTVLRAMLEIHDGRTTALLVQCVGSTMLPAPA